MRAQFLITVFGTDQDGIINAITVKTRELGGKWLANKIVHLDGKLSGLLKLEIEQDQIEAFKTAMTQFEGLEFRVEQLAEVSNEPRAITSVTVEGNDRSGLTTDITRLLGQLDVKITHFESQRYPVVGLGSSVFEAHLDLELPRSLEAASLKAELEQLDNNLRIFVEA